MQIRQALWACSALVVMLTLISALAAAGQTPLGRLAGTVLDESGAVLPGATVTLTNTGTGLVQTATANDVRAFVFPQVPVGPTRSLFR